MLLHAGDGVDQTAAVHDGVFHIHDDGPGVEVHQVAQGLADPCGPPVRESRTQGVCSRRLVRRCRRVCRCRGGCLVGGCRPGAARTGIVTAAGATGAAEVADVLGVAVVTEVAGVPGRVVLTGLVVLTVAAVLAGECDGEEEVAQPVVHCGIAAVCEHLVEDRGERVAAQVGGLGETGPGGTEGPGLREVPGVGELVGAGEWSIGLGEFSRGARLRPGVGENLLQLGDEGLLAEGAAVLVAHCHCEHAAVSQHADLPQPAVERTGQEPVTAGRRMADAAVEGGPLAHAQLAPAGVHHGSGVSPGLSEMHGGDAAEDAGGVEHM